MCFSPFVTTKLLYFVWFGVTSCLLPYLTLHMKSIGVPLWESCLMNGILPLLQLITCPLACSIPKQSTSYKKSTMWSLLFTAISAVLLLMAPKIPRPIKKTISMHFQCGPHIQPAIIVDKCSPQCWNGPILKNGIEAFFTECHVDCPGVNLKFFKNTADLCFDDSHSRVCHVVEVNNTLSENFTFSASLGDSVISKEKECSYPMIGVTWHGNYFNHISCPIILRDTNTKCVLKCDLDEVSRSDASLSGTKLCLKDEPRVVKLAIWAYFGLRCVFHFCLGISSMLVERALVFVVKSGRRNYKKYTVWSLLASGIVTPLAGLILDKKDLVVEGYSNLFLVFTGGTVLTIIMVAALELEGTALPPVKKTVQLFPKLVKELEINVLLLAIFVLGIFSGFLDTFLFWYLEDLKSPHYIMGLTFTSGMLIGLPLLMKSWSNIARRIGGGNLLCLCLLLQSIRCLGYGFVSKFWWCFLFELFGALAFQALWAGVSAYSSVLLPKESRTAFQCASGIMHYSLGKGVGSFVGGILAYSYGFPIAFLVLGSSCLLIGILKFSAYHGILKSLPKNLIQMKERPIEDVAGLEENSAALLKQSVSPESSHKNGNSPAPECSMPLTSEKPSCFDRDEQFIRL